MYITMLSIRFLVRITASHSLHVKTWNFWSHFVGGGGAGYLACLQKNGGVAAPILLLTAWWPLLPFLNFMQRVNLPRVSASAGCTQRMGRLFPSSLGLDSTSRMMTTMRYSIWRSATINSYSELNSLVPRLFNAHVEHGKLEGGLGTRLCANSVVSILNF